MDDKFTKKIQDWLALDDASRSIEEGAGLLLQLNRNRILYQNIIRRPSKMKSKLEYELKKHLRIRLDGLTVRELVILEQKVIPAVDKTLSEPAPDSADLKTDKSGVAAPFRGKRSDHDSLPAEIQKLYEDNGEIFRKLRQTRETLRSMSNAEPCDRYDYCKILGDLDRRYHENWETYDHYNNSAAAQAPTESPASAEESKSEESAEESKSEETAEESKSEETAEESKSEESTAQATTESTASAEEPKSEESTAQATTESPTSAEESKSEESKSATPTTTSKKAKSTAKSKTAAKKTTKKA